MKYQPIHVPEDLNDTDLFNQKIQTNSFDIDHFIVQDDHSDNYTDDGQTHLNNANSSEDESYDELDSSQQKTGMEPNKIVDQKNQVLLMEGSSNSTSVSVTGLTSTSTFLQGLFIKYLH